MVDRYIIFVEIFENLMYLYAMIINKLQDE